MTSSEIPFGGGDPLVDLQLSKLIDHGEDECLKIARGQRRAVLTKGYAKTRDGQGLDEFSHACGKVEAWRDLAALIAPHILDERESFIPVEVRERGRLAADRNAGLIPEMAQVSQSGGEGA